MSELVNNRIRDPREIVPWATEGDIQLINSMTEKDKSLGIKNIEK
jgi:hypothetical protein